MQRATDRHQQVLLLERIGEEGGGAAGHGVGGHDHVARTDQDHRQPLGGLGGGVDHVALPVPVVAVGQHQVQVQT